MFVDFVVSNYILFCLVYLSTVRNYQRPNKLLKKKLFKVICYCIDLEGNFRCYKALFHRFFILNPLQIHIPYRTFVAVVLSCIMLYICVHWREFMEREHQIVKPMKIFLYFMIMDRTRSFLRRFFNFNTYELFARPQNKTIVDWIVFIVV